MEENKRFVLSNAPHIKENNSVVKTMWTVIAALMPAAVYGVFLFGKNALIHILVCILSAVLAEIIIRLLLRRKFSAFNGSAVLTGMLLALTLPPDAPFWTGAAGSFFAIIIVKELFGGLGFNIFNPALAGRALLMAAWPALMTTTWRSFSGPNRLTDLFTGAAPSGLTGIPAQALDVITSATPLAVIKDMPEKLAGLGLNPQDAYSVVFSNDMLRSLAVGNTGGSIGETSALLLLIGGIFLLARKVITWHIPVSFFASFSLIIFAFYHFTGTADPLRALAFHLLAGGLFQGAFFMATDTVTSPYTGIGMIMYGLGCGILTSLVRLYGGHPDGVCFSILLMNAAVPLVDRLVKPRIYGKKR
jgi:Na+-translocating ferredoxin:NAD+ oxidoreductase subunit D